MRIYIAGPMRGRPLLNWPAFDDAARRIRAIGHVPINPAAIDRDNGIRNDIPLDRQTFDLLDIAKNCIEDIADCDAMLLLPGWPQSSGARAEVAFAEWIGLPVHSMDELERAERIVLTEGANGQARE